MAVALIAWALCDLKNILLFVCSVDQLYFNNQRHSGLNLCYCTGEFWFSSSGILIDVCALSLNNSGVPLSRTPYSRLCYLKGRVQQKINIPSSFCYFYVTLISFYTSMTEVMNIPRWNTISKVSVNEDLNSLKKTIVWLKKTLSIAQL